MRFALRVTWFMWAAALAQGATPGNSVPAVWKQQHVNFFYGGRTARYSCDGLRDKVRAMLLDMGARRDLKIMTLRCADGHRRDAPAGDVHAGDPHGALPSLSIDFSAPAFPVMTTRRSSGASSVRPARFEVFMITSDAFRNLGVGDCELVQEFTRQILSRLVTREVRHDIACVADQREHRFFVRGVVLKMLPQAELPR